MAYTRLRRALTKSSPVAFLEGGASTGMHSKSSSIFRGSRKGLERWLRTLESPLYAKAFKEEGFQKGEREPK